MPKIIFDNCVLSNFALSNSLDIVKKLYANESYVTNYVVAENMKGILKGHLNLSKLKDALEEGWLKEITLKSKKEKVLFETLSVSLGMGESSSIAVAKVRSFAFACDDRVERREAEFLDIRLTGTIGILIKAVRKRIITRKIADESLNQMIKNGFYSTIKTINEMI
jgi:predicted nucleic acid-binding protein